MEQWQWLISVAPTLVPCQRQHPVYLFSYGNGGEYFHTGPKTRADLLAGPPAGKYRPIHPIPSWNRGSDAHGVPNGWAWLWNTQPQLTLLTKWRPATVRAPFSLAGLSRSVPPPSLYFTERVYPNPKRAPKPASAASPSGRRPRPRRHGTILLTGGCLVGLVTFAQPMRGRRCNIKKHFCLAALGMMGSQTGWG